MSEESVVQWIGDADASPPASVGGRDVEVVPADDVASAVAAVVDRGPAGVVYAGEDPGSFLEHLRERSPHMPAVVLGESTECEAWLRDPSADVVPPREADGTGAATRLAAILDEEAVSTPVETLVRYETILEAVGDGVYALDDDYEYVLVNEALCELTGYDREALLGANVSTVLTGEDLEAGHEAREAALEAPGEVQTLELELERADGSLVPVENRFAAVVVDGTFAGTVGVVRDVSERRARERELLRKTESLEAFASLVGHDLRNPLSVADGYLEELASAVDHPALVEVDAALDRMGHIIADLLVLARGEEAIETETVALGDVAEAAWETVPTKAATLEVAEDRRLLASRGHLRSLLENLFRNCMDHAAKGDAGAGDGGDAAAVTVTVGATEDGFYVADDGPGFPEAVRGRVFERGVSGDDGTGLGLAIVRSIAEAHDWTVTATESADGGARIEVGDVEAPRF